MSHETYPIAETFTSIQGEGWWTGTPMHFIRLAGCNVGHYAPERWKPEKPDQVETLQIFNPKHSICTSFAGERFLCDTDYHRSRIMSVEDIVTEVLATGVHHVCISGGEPFLHTLNPILAGLYSYVMVHIETSGTLPINAWNYPWITCSPKEHFLPANAEKVDEWKFVVGAHTTVGSIEQFLRPYTTSLARIYIQPINGVREAWKESLSNCLSMLRVHPEWRLSAQLHKYLEVR
jgi:7-carboxy-7-deazaguanine synthase